MSAKTCFVTVGSTSFTPLVHAVLAPDSLAALQSLAFTSLIIQYGNSVLPVIASQTTGKDAGIKIELVQWVDGLERVIADAQLVVSHAGSLFSLPTAWVLGAKPDFKDSSSALWHQGAGSILTTLRLAKPLIVVVNLALMDNHQAELADTLETKHVLVSSTPM